jgi:hypothetical protein
MSISSTEVYGYMHLFQQILKATLGRITSINQENSKTTPPNGGSALSDASLTVMHQVTKDAIEANLKAVAMASLLAGSASDSFTDDFSSAYTPGAPQPGPKKTPPPPGLLSGG